MTEITSHQTSQHSLQQGNDAETQRLLPGVSLDSREDTLLSLNSNSSNNRLSRLGFLLLTVCLFGQQFIWTVELSYGTPYLLSLGLSKQLTALVWLAGPLSGLLVQPLIGALSDHATSDTWIFRLLGRRRPFIIFSTIMTTISALCVGYARELAQCLVNYGSSAPLHLIPSPDDKDNIAVLIAIVSFYVLDFSLNALQATCRALVMDTAPLEQQSTANAWGARMIHAGNVVGYASGYIDLPKLIPIFGDEQVKALCVVASILVILAVGITCVSAKEKPPPRSSENANEPWYAPAVFIGQAIVHLPSEIQKICNIQFFAWMGWFPFLFYSTTWIGEVYGTEGEMGDATRAGSFALLLYSIVSVISGMILPWIASRTHVYTNKNGDCPYHTLSTGPDRICLGPNVLTIFTLSHILFAMLMMLAFVAKTVHGATAIVAALGVCWAAAMWVPFSLIGEYVQSQTSTPREETISYCSTCTPEDAEIQQNTVTSEHQRHLSAGIILGVHNVYVVLPQFLIAGISSLIFHAAETAPDNHRGSVRWVFLFGGFMALIAAMLSRRLT